MSKDSEYFDEINKAIASTMPADNAPIDARVPSGTVIREDFEVPVDDEQLKLLLDWK